MEVYILEVYNWITGTGSSGVEAILLGSLLLLVWLLQKSEVFERLVGSRIRALSLTYGAYALPLMLLLLRTRSRPRGGGGLLRFGLIAILVIIIVIIVVLALIAFLVYRLIRGRR